MPETVRSLFFDTVVLSNFALAGRLDLLARRYGKRAVVTTEVRDEVAEGIHAGYRRLREIEALLIDGVISETSIVSEERETFGQLIGILGAGEASCVACAVARGGTVATDDRVARQCCAERQVPFTGTIGILKACCRDGELHPTEADTILDAMVEHGFYAPVRRISDLL